MPINGLPDSFCREFHGAGYSNLVSGESEVGGLHEGLSGLHDEDELPARPIRRLQHHTVLDADLPALVQFP